MSGHASKTRPAGQKHAEGALWESEEMFRAVFEGATDGILAADIKTKRLVFANPRICEITGYPLRELLRLDMHAIYPKRDLPYVTGQFAKQIQGKTTIARDIPVLRKDKGVVYCDVSSRAIEIKKQRYMAGFFMDITERRRAEEALKEYHQYTRELIESSLDVLMTISAKGKITDVNHETELVTGRSRKEIIGTDFSGYFTDPNAARKGYQQVFHEGHVRDYPLDIKHHDGRVTHVLYNASVYKDTQGRVAGVFAAARDITNRRTMEDELKKKTKELEAKVDELERFNRLTVGRELRMMELKKRIKELEGEQKRAQKT